MTRFSGRSTDTPKTRSGSTALWWLWCNRADVFYRLKRRAEALADLREARKRAPEHVHEERDKFIRRMDD